MRNLVALTMVFGVLLLTSCDGVKTGGTTMTEMEQTETNHQQMVQAVPPPHLTDSLERRNLVARLERLNKADAIGYVYLLSQTGKVMAFYTVKGKVSSLESYLTTPEQVVGVPARAGGYTYHTLPSPDLDGSYGKNPPGIFFFTTENVYVEWSGPYLYSDQPLKLSQQPELIYNVTPPAPASK